MIIQLSFAENRCRNIFYSILKTYDKDIVVYHKPYGSYSNIYIDQDHPVWMNSEDQIKLEYEGLSTKFLETMKELEASTIRYVKTKEEKKDLSGKELLKLNIPSPFSYNLVLELLKNHSIDTKELEGADRLLDSTIVVGVRNIDEFTERWTGGMRKFVRKYENKIDNIIEQNYLLGGTNG